MKKQHLLLILFAVLACSSAAHAETLLTEEAIKAYYAEAAGVYQLDYAGYSDYLERGIHENYEGVVTSTINLPNQPPAQSIERLNKKDMQSSSRRDHAMMQGVKLINEVKAFEIAPDGKTAFVTDRTTIKDMPLPPPPGATNGRTLLLSGSGPCEEVVTITETGQIQALKSDCQFNMTISEEQGL
jgi:hypothetical protein